MALVVDSIKCVEESDEIGSDLVYLVVFQGRTSVPFASAVKVVWRGSLWEFDTGNEDNWDVRAASTNADAMYAVMMVEEDYTPDFLTSDVRLAWHEKTDYIWKKLMLENLGQGIPTNNTAVKSLGFSRIRDALLELASEWADWAPGSTDDVIQVKRVTITSSGQSQTLRFRSEDEDATYDVTFKQTNDP